jgi:hypothetical protein
MRKNFMVRPASLILFPSVLLAACGILGVGEDGNRDLLERNRRRWAENAPANYHFVFQRVCFCPLEIVSPVEVVVRGGVVVSRTYVQTGQPVTTQHTALFPAIEGVFDVIVDALDRGADRLEVTYDGRYGFPTDATFDYVLNAVDDELAFRVRSFTPD